mmetsp:Transcript_6213/g.10667  ORF Transcript_6213/g.10667 Transcript_6213/m.10667 type:complete len:253 (-) Transcript_6213:612-1370(-)
MQMFLSLSLAIVSAACSVKKRQTNLYFPQHSNKVLHLSLAPFPITALVIVAPEKRAHPDPVPKRPVHLISAPVIHQHGARLLLPPQQGRDQRRRRGLVRVGPSQQRSQGLAGGVGPVVAAQVFPGRVDVHDLEGRPRFRHDDGTGLGGVQRRGERLGEREGVHRSVVAFLRLACAWRMLLLLLFLLLCRLCCRCCVVVCQGHGVHGGSPLLDQDPFLLGKVLVQLHLMLFWRLHEVQLTAHDGRKKAVRCER